MIVCKKQESKEQESKKTEYNHISFTTVIQEESNFTVKSFDTLGQNSSNEQYIKSQQTGTQTKQKSKKQTEPSPQIVLKTQITTPKQGASGCGFLTALKAVSHINKYSVDLSIFGKSIKETKKTLIDGFGYKIDENAIDKDGSIKSYPVTIYYENGKKAFEITKDIIETIQQENKEGTQHGTPPIEHKTIAGSFHLFASIGTNSTNDINYNHQPYPSTPKKDNTPSQPFQ